MFGRTLEGKPEATFFKARKMSKHVKKRTGGTPKVSTLKQVSLRSYLCDDLLDQVLGPLRHVPQGVHHALSSIFGTVRHHDHRRRVNGNGESLLVGGGAVDTAPIANHIVTRSPDADTRSLSLNHTSPPPKNPERRESKSQNMKSISSRALYLPRGSLSALSSTDVS